MAEFDERFIERWTPIALESVGQEELDTFLVARGGDIRGALDELMAEMDLRRPANRTRCTWRPRTRREARAELHRVTGFLHGRGFKAHHSSRDPRKSRPGYHAVFPMASGVVPAVYVFDHYKSPGEFARVCAALIEGGWHLEDATGGERYVELGVARVCPH